MRLDAISFLTGCNFRIGMSCLCCIGSSRRRPFFFEGLFEIVRGKYLTLDSYFLVKLTESQKVSLFCYLFFILVTMNGCLRTGGDYIEVSRNFLLICKEGINFLKFRSMLDLSFSFDMLILFFVKLLCDRLRRPRLLAKLCIDFLLLWKEQHL